MHLTDGQRLALANLARKAAGEEVGWINIADARALTEAGLAERDRQGWHITSAGKARLLAEPAAAPDQATDHVEALFPRPDDSRPPR